MLTESIRRLPAPPLRGFVAWYSGYRQAGLDPATHRGLPHPNAQHAPDSYETLAWRSLLTDGGTTSITTTSRRVGWSSRHLRQQFRAETGLTPKAAVRVIRFDRARRLLQRRVADGGQPELADLAAASGYFDQAHLAREFRALAGCAPSRWLSDEFRNVQVPREDPVGE